MLPLSKALLLLSVTVQFVTSISSNDTIQIPFRCGTTWIDANENCNAKPCPNGVDSDCENSSVSVPLRCYGGLLIPPCAATHTSKTLKIEPSIQKNNNQIKTKTTLCKSTTKSTESKSKTIAPKISTKSKTKAAKTSTIPRMKSTTLKTIKSLKTSVKNTKTVSLKPSQSLKKFANQVVTSLSSKSTQTPVPVRTKKLIGFWGQDASFHDNPNTLQKSLGIYCQQGIYDIIQIGFVVYFGGPKYGTNKRLVVNFANIAYYDSESVETTMGMNGVIADIKYCQSLGVKIVMTVGGTHGLYDVKAGEGFSIAEFWYNTMFNGSNSQGIRPFGDVVFDGISFDFESDYDTADSVLDTETAVMIRYFRYRYPKETNFIISAMPQCVYPDKSMGNSILTLAPALDYISIQFYNNPSVCNFNTLLFKYNFKELWRANFPNTTLFVGIPGSPKSAPSGGFDAKDVAGGGLGLLAKLKDVNDDLMGGVAVYDVSSASYYNKTGTGISFANLLYNTLAKI